MTVALLAMGAVFSAAIVGLYLWHGTGDWDVGIKVAMEPDSPIRYLFPLSIAGAILSLAVAVAVAVNQHRLVLRLVLGLAVALTVAYSIVGAWTLALASALPLWWLHRMLRHEV
jgi:hypothetical protein